jgi:hypothetical protein
LSDLFGLVIVMSRRRRVDECTLYVVSGFDCGASNFQFRALIGSNLSAQVFPPYVLPWCVDICFVFPPPILPRHHYALTITSIWSIISYRIGSRINPFIIIIVRQQTTRGTFCSPKPTPSSRLGIFELPSYHRCSCIISLVFWLTSGLGGRPHQRVIVLRRLGRRILLYPAYETQSPSGRTRFVSSRQWRFT